jgi:hypothetical protein
MIVEFGHGAWGKRTRGREKKGEKGKKNLH